MATWSLTPDFNWEETPEFHTLVSQMESGFEQRRNKWSASRRKFRLVFTNRSKTDYETARDFFLARKGAYEAFDWTNPNDSVSYSVRFDGDSFKFINKAYNVYAFECTFIEVM